MHRMEGRVNPTGGGQTDSGHGDTVTTLELLQVQQEKDQLLSALLERLTVVGETQPQPTPTFKVIPDLSQNISAFDGFEDATSARECIENIHRMPMFHGWHAAYML
ncbi:hypothetical protein MTO96_050139 [Rhipicephalus appendiculatus]